MPGCARLLPDLGARAGCMRSQCMADSCHHSEGLLVWIWPGSCCRMHALAVHGCPMLPFTDSHPQKLTWQLLQDARAGAAAVVGFVPGMLPGLVPRDKPVTTGYAAGPEAAMHATSMAGVKPILSSSLSLALKTSSPDT